MQNHIRTLLAFKITESKIERKKKKKKLFKLKTFDIAMSTYIS